MALASEYLPNALRRAVAAAGLCAAVRPVRQFGATEKRTVTWSLTIGPRGARIVRGAGFIGTIDGSSPLMRNYLIEIHEPYRAGDSRCDPDEVMSNIERLSEAIRYEIAGATGDVTYEYDEGSDASQGRAGYLSRMIEITLPAEFLPDLPDFVPVCGRLCVVLTVSASAPHVPGP